VFRLPVVSGGDPVAVLEQVAESGHRRLGAEAGAGLPYDRADLTRPLAVVLGGEARGLPEAVRPLVDEWTNVPLHGAVESLNVAAAGAVLLFEADRRA
jgi:tRNA G18 (ribose-2'-O)-methylase SpoU